MNDWTPKEIALVRRYYPEHGPNWGGWRELLPERSYESIAHAARNRKIHKLPKERHAQVIAPSPSTEPLKTCPFCGSLPKAESAEDRLRRKWWRIRCDYAKCPAKVEVIAPSRDGALRNWNRRSS